MNRATISAVGVAAMALAVAAHGGAPGKEADPCEMERVDGVADEEGWKQRPEGQLKEALRRIQRTMCEGEGTDRPEAGESQREEGRWFFGGEGRGARAASIYWLAEAARAGSQQGQAVLRWMYGAEEAGHLTEEQRGNVKRAIQGNGEAAYRVAKGYEGMVGSGLRKPITENDEAAAQLAMYWYEEAAKLGHNAAQDHLQKLLIVGPAWYWRSGSNEAGREERARKWLKESAEGGFAPAMFDIGVAKVLGFPGYEKNSEVGLNLMREAAGMSDVEHDRPPVILFYGGPAEAGRQIELANALSGNGGGIWQGRGDKEWTNQREAMEWYRKAAASGNPEAQMIVAENLCDENGGLQNCLFAAVLAENLAMQGYALAQARLSWFYWTGQGVPEDNALALAWANIAAGQRDAEDRGRLAITGEELTKYKERLREAVSARQEEEAQRLARGLAAQIKKGGRRGSEGTGILFQQGSVAVTNEHVVGECGEVTVRRGSEIRGAEVAGRDEKYDLALLKLERPLGEGEGYLRRGGKVRAGEEALVAGFPFTGGEGLTVTTGNVSGTRGPGDQTGLFQITAPVQQGNSGGPVIGENGSIVGVVVGKLDAVAVAAATGDLPQNVNYAILNRPGFPGE